MRQENFGWINGVRNPPLSINTAKKIHYALIREPMLRCWTKNNSANKIRVSVKHNRFKANSA
ncbi:hypothetical protein HDU86_001302 [Geranomyces michiganensis]|nr:hypothetical protein HDU86_001302 [Geranomyces michiganensis]